MLPLCADEGIGVIPWSPLARGRLTRDWDASTARSETDEFGKRLYRDSDRAIVEAVAKVAEKRGISRAQVALAWLLSKPVVSAPIVGVTSTGPTRRSRGRGCHPADPRGDRTARGALRAAPPSPVTEGSAHAPDETGQPYASGSKRAVKWRSWRGSETIFMPA